MATRKTTKTAAEPQLSGDVQVDVRTLEQSEQLGRDHGELIIMNQLESDALRGQRFQVALAVLPTVTTDPRVEPLDDENHAGACARIAFEFADAFIAQSKKGQSDGDNH